MFIIPLPITMFSPGEVIYWLFLLLDCGFGWSVTSHGVSPHPAARGTDHYIFRAFPELVVPVLYVKYCHLCTNYELICTFYTFSTWAT